MRNLHKATIGVISAGLLVASLAACSSTAASDSGSTSPSKPSASADATPKPLASIPTLTGVDTAVLLDSNFTAALTSLGLTPGVDGTATLVDGSLHFPITGGNVDYYDPAKSYRPYVQGTIKHEGSGFSLTGGGKKVDLTNFTIDPGKSLLYGDVGVNGATAATQAVLFNLDGTTLKPLQTEGTNAVLEGTTVHISKVAADLLDKTFNTDAVKSQLLVGVAKITVIAK